MGRGWIHADELCVRDVPVTREEARPAGLQGELLAPAALQHLDLIVPDDPVADDLVPIRAVRHLEGDLVAGLSLSMSENGAP